ncbi:YncE family protein [Streptomyces sp. NPDC002520]
MSVIDTDTGAVIANIDLGDVFLGDLGGDIAVIPDGRHLYVSGGRKSVTVLDIATNQVAAKIALPEGLTPATGVAIAPDGRRAFVLVQKGEDGGEMCVIDTETQSITDRITGLSVEPFGLQISPDGKRAYVSHGGDSGMVIDLASQKVQVLPYPFEGPFWMAITPDSNRAYIGADQSDLYVTDLTTEKGTDIFPTQRAIGGVAITPDGRRVYVSQGDGQGDGPNVMVIDTVTDKPTCCPASWYNARPRGMAITPDGKHVYVTDSRYRKVMVIPVPEGG